MSEDSDLTKVIKNAQTQGFRYSKTSSGHHQLYAPNGHDIIIHSGTSSDRRGFYNFLSDLRKAGYMELQTLGDAMPQSEKRENGGAKLSASQHLIDLLSRHPEGLSTQDIASYIRTVRPDLGITSPSNAIFTLVNRGAISKASSGLYVLKDLKAANFKKPPKTLPSVGPSDGVPAGVRTGNVAIDKDLKALDEALSALAKLESVVRRNRETLIQFAKLKELLK